MNKYSYSNIEFYLFNKKKDTFDFNQVASPIMYDVNTSQQSFFSDKMVRK